MPARIFSLLLTAAFLLLTALSPDSFGDRRRHVDEGRGYLARAGVSLDAAVARVQRETGGRVLSATTVQQNGHRVHRIKVLLPSGKVRVYQVDAGS